MFPPNNNFLPSLDDPRTRPPFNEPDTDSRLNRITNGDTNVTLNFFWDHTRQEYIVPTGNTQNVSFNTPINIENRSLHWLVLDNSNNNADKVFNFAPIFIFLDNPENEDNSYTVPAGGKFVWFGAYVNGKLYFRIASESTL